MKPIMSAKLAMFPLLLIDAAMGKELPIILKGIPNSRTSRLLFDVPEPCINLVAATTHSHPKNILERLAV